MLRAIASPPLFPAFVAHHSASFDADAPLTAETLDGVALPAALDGAVAKRKHEFAAGRSCARAALRALGAAGAAAPIAIGPDRAPAWPDGFVGAITHCRGFASAAVARREQLAGLGLDSEVRLTAALAASVAPSIAGAAELRALGDDGDPLVLTIVFSAKESIFKCLHRHVGRYFDFRDAEVTQLDVAAGRFAGRLLRDLAPGLAAGAPLHGRLAVDGERVHTGMLLAALADGPRWL